MSELPQQKARATRIQQVFEIFEDSKTYGEAKRRVYEKFAIQGISERKIQEYLRIGIIVKGEKYHRGWHVR